MSVSPAGTPPVVAEAHERAERRLVGPAPGKVDNRSIIRLPWAYLVGIVVLGVTACAGSGDQPGSGSPSPPITESESGRVVGQPIEVDGLRVSALSEGLVAVVARVTVPSPCHQPVLGWEEPDADGVLRGSAESWLDPDCDTSDTPASQVVVVEVPLPTSGTFVACIPGVAEVRFSLPNSWRAEGPILTSPLPNRVELEGAAAIVAGVLAHDPESSCLSLELEGIAYPVVWPAGTTWDDTEDAVILPDGRVVSEGTTVEGGGGYYSESGLTAIGGEEVATAASECAGPTGEIAHFNHGSHLEITIGP